MQTQSAAFKLAAAATVLYPVDRATLQTADGRTFNLGPDDIIAGSLSVDSGIFDEGIEIGSTVVSECNIGLNNSDGRWDEIDLEDAVLIPYSGLKLPDTTTEDFKLGTFIIDDPGYPYLQVTISASDKMLLLDEPFLAVTRTFPATSLQILQAIGIYCGVTLASSITGILNASYSVTTRPTDDITCRDVVGMIAMMAAGYARMNRNGELEIVQFPALAVDNTIDGNGTDTYTLDGLATDSLYDIGGALFTDLFGYQGAALDMGVDSRYSFKQIREPVTVSGIQYNGTDSTMIIGADNYLVVVDNCPLIQSGADAVIQSIYAAIVGFAYTGFTAEYPGNPTIDLGDVVRHITPDGKIIMSLIASHNFAHGKRSTMETTAKSSKEKKYKASVAELLAKAQSTADTATTAIDALAPLGLVELAKLGTTIMEGGYIKAALLDVLTLIAGTLSNSVDADFFTKTGDVVVGARNLSGLLGYKKSYSDTNPVFRLISNEGYLLLENYSSDQLILSDEWAGIQVGDLGGMFFCGNTGIGFLGSPTNHLSINDTRSMIRNTTSGNIHEVGVDATGAYVMVGGVRHAISYT